MLILLAMLPLVLAPVQTLPGPMQTVKAAYGKTDVFSAGVSPDGRYAFVAQAGQIVMLDLDDMSLPVGTIVFDAALRVNAAVRAVELHGNELYIAGGTFGVLRASLPGTYSTSTLFTVSAVKVDDYVTPTTLAGNNWKECLDVKWLDLPSPLSPQLLALFTGRSGTELRSYPLNSGTSGNPNLGVANVKPIPVSAGPEDPSFHFAYQMAVDPTSPFVYVALGVEGVIRVDMSNPAAPVIANGPTFPLVSYPGPGTTQIQLPARTTSVSTVNHFLYLAIDKWGVAEMDISTPSAWSTGSGYNYRQLPALDHGQQSLMGFNVAYSVSAAEDTNHNILVAVTSRGFRLSPVETFVLRFTIDKTCPLPSFDESLYSGSHLHLLSRLNSAAPVPTTPTAITGAMKICDCLFGPCQAPLAMVGWLTPGDIGGQWGGAFLRYHGAVQGSGGGPAQFWVHTWHKFSAAPPPFASWALGTPFQSGTVQCLNMPPIASMKYTPTDATVPVDAVIPLLNPDLIIQSTESGSPGGRPLTISGCPASSITMIPATPSTGPTLCDGSHGGAGPLGASIIDGAHWLEGPQMECFIGGSKAAVRKQVQPTTTCNMAQAQVWCSYANYLTPNVWGGASFKSTGWILNCYDPQNFGLSPKWWQLQSPPDPHSITADAERRRGELYFSSLFDDRGGPDDMIYLLRSGVPDGLITIKRQELFAYFAAQACSPANDGNGQFLDLEALNTAQTLHHSIVSTHDEWAETFSCSPGMCQTCANGQQQLPEYCVDCSINPPINCSTNNYLRAGQNGMLTLRGDVAWVQSPRNGLRRILAIAAGHANNTCTHHPGWSARYNQGMVDFYDVTDVPPNGGPVTPTLIGIGFLADSSNPSLRSSATAVHIALLGAGNNERSYAFVGDLNGRVWIFDLSTLYTTLSPTDPQVGLTPILGATWPTVLNPPSTAFNDWDGDMNNVDDLVVEVVSPGDAYVYAANGQGGLAVLTYTGFNEANGPMPVLAGPVNQVDTPGDCRGVEFRTCGSGTKTLVVSDYTGGLRIFGR